MDKFNLSVYVEQLNHEADSTILDKWEENEELALNNVIDPNTEFKVILVLLHCIPPSCYMTLLYRSSEILRTMYTLRCLLYVILEQNQHSGLHAAALLLHITAIIIIIK